MLTNVLLFIHIWNEENMTCVIIIYINIFVIKNILYPWKKYQMQLQRHLWTKICKKRRLETLKNRKMKKKTYLFNETIDISIVITFQLQIILRIEILL